MLLLGLMACNDTVALEGAFDGPDASAVLHPETGGPFYEPVAFVANSRNGRIVPLDLKHGWVLADDPAAPFLNAQQIPTGSERILGPLQVWAPDAETVVLFAADAHNQRLLEIDYVQGLNEDGHPITARPVLVGEVLSSGAAVLEELHLRQGRAATEDWVLRFEGSSWVVTGSRSGEQLGRARPLEPYATDDEALEFIVSGPAAEGDTITLSVDSGVDELDLGGFVEALYMLPDQSALLASVTSLEEGTARLVAVDPLSGAVAEIPLPAGARPWRMAGDPSSSLVYVADSRSPAVYELIWNGDAPGASPVRTLVTDGAVVDLAWQGDADWENLFVATAAQNRVDVYDLVQDAWLDVNPLTPELDGIDTQTPVTGLGAAVDPVYLQLAGAYGTPGYEKVLAISTLEGVVRLAQGRTGCLVSDEYGPWAELDDVSPFLDAGDTSNPSFEAGGATGRAVQVNPCGGTAVNETWSLVFDGAAGAWQVTGSIVGVQEAPAYENVRYISDGGEISFLLRSGTLPSTSGDTFTVHVYDGIAEITGDTNEDGLTTGDETRMELPARPVPFSYLAGPEGESWEPVNRKVGVLWPQTNSDSVLRVNFEGAQVDAVWD
jgi:hypothetical protein